MKNKVGQSCDVGIFVGFCCSAVWTTDYRSMFEHDLSERWKKFWLLYSYSYGSRITDFYFLALQELSVMLISPVSINVHKSQLKQFDT